MIYLSLCLGASVAIATNDSRLHTSGRHYSHAQRRARSWIAVYARAGPWRGAESWIFLSWLSRRLYFLDGNYRRQSRLANAATPDGRGVGISDQAGARSLDAHVSIDASAFHPGRNWFKAHLSMDGCGSDDHAGFAKEDIISEPVVFYPARICVFCDLVSPGDCAELVVAATGSRDFASGAQTHADDQRPRPGVDHYLHNVRGHRLGDVAGPILVLDDLWIDFRGGVGLERARFHYSDHELAISARTDECRRATTAFA